ncbi:hypothetical protein FRB90_001068 [Tulasnella sp. 427]|nr:hypothetical protein FRB90_001068 [Tulasnella sp. 427]
MEIEVTPPQGSELDPYSSTIGTNYSQRLSTAPTLVGDPPPRPERRNSLIRPVMGGLNFWLIFAALIVTSFLSAIDLTSVSTALPTIVEDLHGTEFAWVGSAFTLGSTAVLPLIGGLGQVFGRRPVVLGSIAFFALGSAISGGARNMGTLIAGRTFQGIGSGGITAMTAIVVNDLVPLSKRGSYMGIIAAVWGIAAAIGPPIGGAFAQSNWRWLFFLNLPLTAIAGALVWFFLHLKFPQDDFKSKMRRMDWIGNLIIIAGTTLSIIALTWAGVKYAWSSYQVFIPLIFGLEAIIAFFVYEAKFAIEPVVPLELISTRNSILGYATVFLHGIVSTVIIYYLPVYFQTARQDTPIQSGVSLFATAFTVGPGAIIAGVTVVVFGIYLPQNLVGWGFTAIGVGLLSLLKVETAKSQWVGFQILEGLGMGIIWSAPQFPILASLPVAKGAQALALLSFVRSYSQTWGVTIGATILQNELRKKLPAEFLAQFPSKGVEIAYAIIPQIPGLPEPVKTEVQDAFTASLRPTWLTMTALSAIGFLCVLGMQELEMHKRTDDEWGMDGQEQGKPESAADPEKAEVTDHRLNPLLNPGYAYTHLSIVPNTESS